MKIFKILFFVFAFSLSLTAFAGRTPVPIVDFKDVPVSASTNKILTVDQVGQAIQAAAMRKQWEIKKLAGGVLQAEFVKQSKHTVIVTIAYDADKYSVSYKDSDNMSFSAASISRGTYSLSPAYGPIPDDQEADRQRARFRKSLDSQYAIVKTSVIHPAYEGWVHDLLDGIRLQLRKLE